MEAQPPRGIEPAYGDIRHRVDGGDETPLHFPNQPDRTSVRGPAKCLSTPLLSRDVWPFTHDCGWGEALCLSSVPRSSCSPLSLCIPSRYSDLPDLPYRWRFPAHTTPW